MNSYTKHLGAFLVLLVLIQLCASTKPCEGDKCSSSCKGDKCGSGSSGSSCKDGKCGGPQSYNSGYKPVTPPVLSPPLGTRPVTYPTYPSYPSYPSYGGMSPNAGFCQRYCGLGY